MLDEYFKTNDYKNLKITPEQKILIDNRATCCPSYFGIISHACSSSSERIIKADRVEKYGGGGGIYCKFRYTE